MYIYVYIYMLYIYNIIYVLYIYVLYILYYIYIILYYIIWILTMKLSNASTLLQWIRVSSLGEPLSTSKSVLFRVTSWPCLVPQEPGVHLAPSNDWSSVSLKNYSKWEFIPQFERHQTIILWALDPNAIIYTHESYSLKHLSFSPSLGLTIIYHRTMMVHPWSPSVKQILAAKHLFHFECYHYCTHWRTHMFQDGFLTTNQIREY